MESVSYYPSIPEFVSAKYCSPAEKEKLRKLKAEYETVFQLLRQISADLKLEYHNFDYLIDEKSIDACIYRIQASQSRYDCLLRQQKRLCKKISLIQQPNANV